MDQEDGKIANNESKTNNGNARYIFERNVTFEQRNQIYG
jgi:hypothetical protein